MAFAAVGLKTQIWNNNLISVALLILFPCILIAMVWGFFALSAWSAQGFQGTVQITYQPRSLPQYLALPPVQAGFFGVQNYWHIPILAASGWLIFSFLFHSWMIDKTTGARAMSRKENPRIYNMLENLCISRGITIPKLNIIDEPNVLNAYASGISDKSYSITLTSGLINRLDDAELETVIGHELTHIMNQDVRLLIISVIFVGMIGFLCQVVYEISRMMLRNRHMSIRNRDEGKGAVIFLLIGLAVLVIGYLFSQLTRFALSRRREYLADAGAVELTKNPDGMITALKKISGASEMPDVPPDVRQMFIDNPPAFFGLLGTHPPIKNRIHALIGMGGRDLPVMNAPNSIPSGPWS
jgi:heat shock protein HtpX